MRHSNRGISVHSSRDKSTQCLAQWQREGPREIKKGAEKNRGSLENIKIGKKEKIDLGKLLIYTQNYREK